MIIERTYNIPLRKEWLKSPKYKRAKKAMIAVKEFLAKHMHQEDFSKIKLGEHINLAVWENGIKNPPHHIKVNVKKLEDGVVYAELFGYEIKLPESEEEKKSKKKTVKSNEKKETVKGKEKNEEEKPEEKEDAKEKEEVKAESEEAGPKESSKEEKVDEASNSDVKDKEEAKK